MTFNRHIYQSANRSSERRLGPVGFPKVSDIPFLNEVKIRIEEKNTDMKKIVLVVKNAIAWITINEKDISPIRVVSHRNPLNRTNNR